MSRECAFFAAARCARNAHARATTSRPCLEAFRRTIATTWSRTARFPSPANFAARIIYLRRARLRRKANYAWRDSGGHRIVRAATGAGAELSGTARLGKSAGAGYRRYNEKHDRDGGPLRACAAACAVAGCRWTGLRSDRLQGRRLGLRVSPLCPRKRTHESGGRQARTGRLFQDWPQLRHWSVTRAQLYAPHPRHHLRFRSGLACLQYDRVARRHRRQSARRKHVAHSGIRPRLADRLSDQSQGARGLLYFHPFAIAWTHRHQWLRGAWRGAARSRAGFLPRGRGFGHFAAPGAQPFQRLPAVTITSDCDCVTRHEYLITPACPTITAVTVTITTTPTCRTISAWHLR